MDWQSPLAAGIAILCALWMVWQIVRPFTTGIPAACGGCTFYGVDGKSEGDELLQLEPLRDTA